MSFIRAKEIPPRSGNWYDYEVESVWNNGKPRQKVIRYIGRSTRIDSRALGGIRDISPMPEINTRKRSAEELVKSSKIEGHSA